MQEATRTRTGISSGLLAELESHKPISSRYNMPCLTQPSGFIHKHFICKNKKYFRHWAELHGPTRWPLGPRRGGPAAPWLRFLPVICHTLHAQRTTPRGARARTDVRRAQLHKPDRHGPGPRLPPAKPPPSIHRKPPPQIGAPKRTRQLHDNYLFISSRSNND